MPKHSKTILDEHVNELQNYITSKNRLKRVNNEDVNTKSTETCDTTKINMTPITLSEKSTEIATAIPDYPASLKTQDALDALSMIIMLAKKAGATELIIKLSQQFIFEITKISGIVKNYVL